MSPSENSSTYLLVINGKPEGPFSLEQLKERQIKYTDFVRSSGMDDYKEAHEIAELRGFLGFDKQALVPQYFGNFDQRLLASALDWFFVSGTCIIVVFIATLIFADKATLLIAALCLLVLIPVIKLIYHIVMESSAKRGTFGKQILTIKVCDMHGEQITVARATGRNLAKIFSVMIFFIGYLFCFFNKKQQCLHDMIADTLVMKDRLF